MLALAATAAAQTVITGVDLWETSLFATAQPTIPAGFFGPGSIPFTGTITLRGYPLITKPGTPQLLKTDTIVRRLALAPLGAPPATAPPIPIEIVALSLVSVNPITVTYGGGATEQWKVLVCPSQLSPQPLGSMTITRNCTAGGTFSSTLPVRPRFIFTRVGVPSTLVLDSAGPTLEVDLTATGPWVFVADPPVASPVRVTVPNIVVDCDQDGIFETVIATPTSNFVAGVGAFPCTPATSGPQALADTTPHLDPMFAQYAHPTRASRWLLRVLDCFTGQYYPVGQPVPVSVSQSALLDIELNAGQDYAHQPFVMFISTTGTSPGLKLPPGQVLSLNPPLITAFTAAVDSQGRLDLPVSLPPNPMFLGLQLSLAYATGSPVVYTTNSSTLHFVP